MQIIFRDKSVTISASLLAGLIIILIMSPVAAHTYQEKKNQAAEGVRNSCFTADKLDSERLYPLGNLNKKALNKKPIKYPDRAIRPKLPKVVIVDVVIDLPTGEIEKARFRKPNDFFNAEIMKTICATKFPPFNDANVAPFRGIGYLTFTLK